MILEGKVALVTGSTSGIGLAIAKALAEAGASVCVGTWPPALNIFLNLLERGKMDESRRLSDGSLLTFEKIYPLDAVFDTYDAMPEELRTSKRYKDVGDCSIDGVAQRLSSKPALEFFDDDICHAPPLVADAAGDVAADTDIGQSP